MAIEPRLAVFVPELLTHAELDRVTALGALGHLGGLRPSLEPLVTAMGSKPYWTTSLGFSYATLPIRLSESHFSTIDGATEGQ